jgi:hypothetical protein
VLDGATRQLRQTPFGIAAVKTELEPTSEPSAALRTETVTR